MALSYNSPGVYVEEVTSGTRPIEAVGTSIAAFVGVAPKIDACVNEAVAVNNWTQFVKIFSGDGDNSTDLARAVYGFFNNGGARCYVVNVGREKKIIADERKRTGVNVLEPIEDISIIAAPGFSDPVSYDALISHCKNVRGRIAILDPPEQADIDQLKKVVQVKNATEAVDNDGESTSSRHRKQSTGLRPPSSDLATFYFPWIKSRDPLAKGSPVVNTAPSGHIAGIYARSDSLHGVHKAPANETINGALGLCYQISRSEQGGLNEVGVNCIRYFPDSGIRVWGARTLSSDPQWRYINVRRLFLMIIKSIERGTNWVVFEPNDERTWKSIERDTRAFLMLLWRDGALKGNTPEQAFYVKCDSETNPPEVINAGRLITEIGIAPVKPAEFIIFRIGQWEGGSEVETT